jgi:hypothetical protein
MNKLDLVTERLRAQGYRPFAPTHNDGRAQREMPGMEHDEPKPLPVDVLVLAFAVGLALGMLVQVVVA